MLSAPAGCSSSAALCKHVLGHLQRSYPDRFAYADCTKVERVVVAEDRVVVHGGSHRVVSGHVVLCTNGFVDHVVEDETGGGSSLHPTSESPGALRT